MTKRSGPLAIAKKDLFGLLTELSIITQYPSDPPPGHCPPPGRGFELDQGCHHPPSPEDHRVTLSTAYPPAVEMDHTKDTVATENEEPPGDRLCQICYVTENSKLVEPVLTQCGHLYCW